MKKVMFAWLLITICGTTITMNHQQQPNNIPNDSATKEKIRATAEVFRRQSRGELIPNKDIKKTEPAIQKKAEKYNQNWKKNLITQEIANNTIH